MEHLQHILAYYPLAHADWQITPFGTGLINTTFRVHATNLSQQYILQKLNTAIFKDPQAIAGNNQQIAQYLQTHFPDYLFVTPLLTSQGKSLVHLPESGYFRLTPFVPHSHTIDVVSTPQQAYEAAKQFGTFTSHLHGFNAQNLQLTLPNFHNLTLRFQQFEQAVAGADAGILASCKIEVTYLQGLAHYVQQYQQYVQHKTLPLRVIHHDTKISNTLFNDDEKGICVIDLDTVMPGYFISDVGDMCRTYLSPASEEATDFDQIHIRIEYFEALATGYLEPMKKVMTKQELDAFVYAGVFMIYMQALRFVTDYLLGNPYYPILHPQHNLYRTRNQIALLKSYLSAEKELIAIVEKLCV